MTTTRILVYGFGNPGREDDGLGIALAEKLERERIPCVTIETSFQLNTEDAQTLAEHEMAIFVDASMNSLDGYRFTALNPGPSADFTTHAVHPGAVVALCRQLYGRNPPSYLLEIEGVSWNMQEHLSPSAQTNLETAFQFLKTILLSDQPGVSAAREAKTSFNSSLPTSLD